MVTKPAPIFKGGQLESQISAPGPGVSGKCSVEEGVTCVVKYCKDISITELETLLLCLVHEASRLAAISTCQWSWVWTAAAQQPAWPCWMQPRESYCHRQAQAPQTGALAPPRKTVNCKAITCQAGLPRGCGRSWCTLTYEHGWHCRNSVGREVAASTVHAAVLGRNTVRSLVE